MKARMAASALAAISIASTAAADRRRPAELRPLVDLPAAHPIAPRIPQRVDLRIGERRSFRGAVAAGTAARHLLDVQATGGILTVRAIAEGTGEVLLIGATGPSKLIVTVRNPDR